VLEIATHKADWFVAREAEKLQGLADVELARRNRRELRR
jgi:hypothetical protein